MTQSVVPTTPVEIVDLAIERARLAQATQVASTDFGVGFSEGVICIGQTHFTMVWCAVVNSHGGVGVAGGLVVKLPNDLKNRLLVGELKESEIEQFVEYVSDDPYTPLVTQAVKALNIS